MIPLIAEWCIKALVPLLIKEFWEIAKSSLEGEDIPEEAAKIAPNLQTMLDLTSSLQAENNFQREEIERLRAALQRVRTRLAPEDNTNLPEKD